MQDINNYIYYSMHNSTEHMLYSSELAKHFKIVSSTNKPHTKFLSHYLKSHAKKHCPDYIQMHYLVRGTSMKEVFPAKIYRPIIQEIFEAIEEKNVPHKFIVEDRSYSVSIL